VNNVGDTNPAVELLVGGLEVFASWLGLTVVQAATSYAVVELDEGRPVSATAALRQAARRWRPLLKALAIVVVAADALDFSVIGAIAGAYLVVRWSLFAQAIMIGDGTADGPLRQSLHATRRHFWRTASVTLFITGSALLIGPLLGAMLLFATNASFNFVNIVAAIVEALLTPLVAITTTYLYFDLQIRSKQAAEAGAGAIAPAEA
jgi:hypothetical protein